LQTSLLRDRHWLPVKQRVEYQLYMLVDRCTILPGGLDHDVQLPEMVSDLLHPVQLLS